MNWLRQHGRPLVVCLTLHLGACTAWHVESSPLADVLAQRHPSRVRVTRTDSLRVVVYAPRLVGDTLEGLAAEPRAFQSTPDSVRLRIPEIKQVATRRFSWERSIAAVAAGLVAGTAVAILFECQTQNCVP